MTPRCERCGFDIDTAEHVWTTQHMLFVQSMEPAHRDDPPSAKNVNSEPFWVCGHCHEPKEKVLSVVKEAEQVA
jgi:hypothetical protein